MEKQNCNLSTCHADLNMTPYLEQVPSGAFKIYEPKLHFCNISSITAILLVNPFGKSCLLPCSLWPLHFCLQQMLHMTTDAEFLNELLLKMTQLKDLHN